MTNWHKVDMLDVIELYAEDNGMIASEEELSARFDRDVLPVVLETYSESDSVAICEAFNDWTDSLCKDGEIHPEQYNHYCYVGRLAED